MASLSRLLAADTAGHGFLKAHEYSCYALGVATPLALVSGKGGFLQKTADLTMAFAIPVHMHYGLCACVTDYFPKAARGPARVVALGASVVTYMGLMKMTLAGPGITQTVKGLWNKPAK